VIHTPNHRGAKGTEFVQEAIERLRSEGLQIELVLVERMPNEEVRRLMRTADILAEQFIFTGYAFSGIEGMASGLAVMSNLENETYTRLLRRFSFLDECPILSTTPESLYENLGLLVRNPKLRRALGTAGRAYVEKYHSYRTSQYMFGAVYDRIVHGKDVELQRIFHPLLGDYNRSVAKVDHPLVESRLPADSAYRIEAKRAERGQKRNG
jgi:glycosyltransferase involved in cell wall biosynthesis